jgi:hypothetical protein
MKMKQCSVADTKTVRSLEFYVVLFLSLIFCKQKEKLLFFGSVSGCTCLILNLIYEYKYWNTKVAGKEICLVFLNFCWESWYITISTQIIMCIPCQPISPLSHHWLTPWDMSLIMDNHRLHTLFLFTNITGREQSSSVKRHIFLVSQ